MNIFWLHEGSSDSALKNAELDHIMPLLRTWQWLPKQSLQWSSRTHMNCPSYLSGLSPLPTLSYHTGFLSIPRTFQAWPWLRPCALSVSSAQNTLSLDTFMADCLVSYRILLKWHLFTEVLPGYLCKIATRSPLTAPLILPIPTSHFIFSLAIISI